MGDRGAGRANGSRYSAPVRRSYSAVFGAIILTKRKKRSIILCDRAGQSRRTLPKGITVRKVRASQSRIADNVRLGRPTGKCNRNKPPFYGKDGKAR